MEPQTQAVKQTPKSQPSRQQQNTDLKRSVFVFSTPKDQANPDVARSLMKKFDMRRVKFDLPDRPQNYSFLYLLTQDEPADFDQPRVYKFNEVSNVTAANT